MLHLVVLLYESILISLYLHPILSLFIIIHSSIYNLVIFNALRPRVVRLAHWGIADLGICPKSIILHKSEDANGSQDFAVLQIPSFSIALLNAIYEMTTHKQQKLESNIYS